MKSRSSGLNFPTNSSVRRTRWRHCRRRRRKSPGLKARVDSAESELASAYAELEALSEQVATFKKKYAKKVAKRLMKELVKSTGKNAGKISKKKLLKILSLSEGE